FDQVSRSSVQFGGPSRDAFALAADDTLEFLLVHESGHAVTTHRRALTIELVPDLFNAIHAEVIAVDAADLAFELFVALASGRQRTAHRRVVGGRGNLQHPADRLGPR